MPLKVFEVRAQVNGHPDNLLPKHIEIPSKICRSYEVTDITHEPRRYTVEQVMKLIHSVFGLEVDGRMVGAPDLARVCQRGIAQGIAERESDELERELKHVKADKEYYQGLVNWLLHTATPKPKDRRAFYRYGGKDFKRGVAAYDEYLKGGTHAR